MTLEWLLRRAVRGSGRALTMATTTLDGMSRGGIYDLVGGGFARYSTDERWHVPHFEKMLSDNAQLAQVYARAWVVTRDPVYRAVALATAEFLCAELLQPGGGFASSLDADVDGLEGAFYVWNWQELVNTVGEAAARSLGGRPDGNWGSTNVLWSPQEPGVDTLRPAVDLDDERNRLRAARAGRARPATDDKIVTAWNGLAIRALCETGRIFGMAEHIGRPSGAPLLSGPRSDPASASSAHGGPAPRASRASSTITRSSGRPASRCSRPPGTPRGSSVRTAFSGIRSNSSAPSRTTPSF